MVALTDRMSVEPVAQCNGPRIAALVDPPEVPEVEVINLHISRARIKPGAWPRRHPLSEIPRSTRVYVETPDGVACPVTVMFRIVEEYIYAHGHQDYICRGENVELGGAFPRESELLAERLALSLL